MQTPLNPCRDFLILWFLEQFLCIFHQHQSCHRIYLTHRYQRLLQSSQKKLWQPLNWHQSFVLDDNLFVTIDTSSFLLSSPVQ